MSQGYTHRLTILATGVYIKPKQVQINLDGSDCLLNKLISPPDGIVCTCVPSNFMAHRRVPKFSLNNCAQSSKKTFMCPKVCTIQY